MGAEMSFLGRLQNWVRWGNDSRIRIEIGIGRTDLQFTWCSWQFHPCVCQAINMWCMTTQKKVLHESLWWDFDRVMFRKTDGTQQFWCHGAQTTCNLQHKSWLNFQTAQLSQLPFIQTPWVTRLTKLMKRPWNTTYLKKCHFPRISQSFLLNMLFHASKT